MKPIIVNLFGAAGSGKSTLAAEIFYKLKRKGINCEYVQEYAKNVVYEENYKRLNNQLFIFSNQYYNLEMLRDKVDVIVTDSPIILSVFYNQNCKNSKIPTALLANLIMNCHNSFDNLNYFIKRNHEYKQEGRYQNEKQAIEDEKVIYKLINQLGIDFKSMLSTDNCANTIIDDVEKRLNFIHSFSKNGPEIERKFLIHNLPKNITPLKKDCLFQAYLKSDEGTETRIRSVNNKKFYLTQKYGNGLIREELEKEISSEEFESLLNTASNNYIKKIRLTLPLSQNHLADLDIYDIKTTDGKNLMTVEVEFKSEEEANEFEPPNWFGEEITNKTEFSNYNLAQLEH